MSFVILIPARSGSKRIKNKNLKLFNNQPLIYWTIKAAKECSINDIFISTDSEEIKKFSLSNGINVPFKRPKKLSADNSKMIDVAKHFCKWLENYGQFKNLILLQPTSPLRTWKDINDAVKVFKKKQADTVVSAYDSKELKELTKLMQIDKTGDIQNFTDINKKSLLVRNGPSILISKIQIIKSGSFYGRKIVPFLMKKKFSIDIDNIDEFEISEIVHKKFKMDN